MPKDLDELDQYEVFYEDIGPSELAGEVDYENVYPSEVEPAQGLDEADVYKLNEDMNEDIRFEEQIEPHKDE